MVDKVKLQNKTSRIQFEREIAFKTELEYYLKKVVRKVVKERRKLFTERSRNAKSSSKFYITEIESTTNL